MADRDEHTPDTEPRQTPAAGDSTQVGSAPAGSDAAGSDGAGSDGAGSDGAGSDGAGSDGAKPDLLTRLGKLWRRVGHIYKTRVRTTTVILVILFVAGLALYSYTSQRYEQPTQEYVPVQRAPDRGRQQTEPTRETSTPESTSEAEEPSGSSRPESTGQESSSETETTAPWYLPRIAPTETSGPGQPQQGAPQQESEASQVPSIH